MPIKWEANGPKPTSELLWLTVPCSCYINTFSMLIFILRSWQVSTLSRNFLLLWNPLVHYHIHKYLPLELILGRTWLGFSWQRSFRFIRRVMLEELINVIESHTASNLYPDNVGSMFHPGGSSYLQYYTVFEHLILSCLDPFGTSTLLF
jgi:hypothetical protein